MKPLVIGTREDVAGFALAGVEGVACTTAEEARRALAQADEQTLVIWGVDAPCPEDRQARAPVFQLRRS